MNKNTPATETKRQRSWSRSNWRRRVKAIEKSSVRHARRFVTKRLDHLSSVRRHIIGWVVLVAVLVGVSAWQWLGFRSHYMISAAASGGSFSEGVLGPLDTLNPIYARTSAEKSAAKLLFAGLYRYDESGSLSADLAEKLSVDDTEHIYTVTLKKDLKWSDGAPLTADDVVFTVGLLKNRTARAEFTGWESIELKKIDTLTVSFQLAAAYAPFQTALTFPLLPKHTLGDVDPSQLREHVFGEAPISSGPFALRSVQEGSRDSKKVVQLVANPYYHRGTARLERFQLHVYHSRDDIIKGLASNEIIATPELNYANMSDSIKNKYASSSHPTSGGTYALFNTTTDVLQSEAVRQALSIGIDRAKLREHISRSLLPLDGPLIDDQIEGSLPEFPAYDVEKAKRLLDDDGWKLVGDVRKKGDQTLTLSVVTLKGYDNEKASEELGKMWSRNLGVKIDLRIVDQDDPAQDVSRLVLKPRNFDVLVYELILGADPDVFAYWHSSQVTAPNGLNFANYSNVVVDDALTSGRSKLGDKRRADRYQSFVRRWLVDTPAIPLYRSQMDYIQRPSVETIGQNTKYAYPADRYSNVLYWTVNQSLVYKTP